MLPLRATWHLASLSAFALALAIAGPARADKYLFTGTHAIKFSQNGVLREVVSPTGTGVAMVNKAGSSVHLNTLQLTRPFAEINTVVMSDGIGSMGTEPISNEISEIHFNKVRIDPSRAGLGGMPGIFGPIFSAAGGMGTLLQSTLPAAGTIRLCVNAGCAAPGGTLMVNLVQNDMTPSGMNYAIGPGVQSTSNTFTAIGMTGTSVSVMGYPWTVNAAKAKHLKKGFSVPVTLTSVGFAKGPGGNPGTTLSMAGMGGMVQLVTPIQTTCTGSCGSVNSPAAFVSRLTLTFTPEPRLFVLLGAGAAGVVLLGRTRVRR